MKTRVRFLVVGSVLLTLFALAACNKPSTPAAPGVTAVPVAEMQDMDVTHKVTSALHFDKDLKNFDIAVVTLKGDVRLTGVVDSQSRIDQVNTLVRGLDGVHSVHGELTIKN